MLAAWVLLACATAGQAQDTAPPQLVSATSATGQDIAVMFSEVMSAIGLNAALNYQVTNSGGPVAISSVTIWPGNTSVVLRLSVRISGTFTLAAQRVKDVAGNSIPAGSSVTGHVWSTPLTVLTVGAPNPALQLLAGEEGHLIVRAGGINTFDSFDLPYLTRTNDFDMRVKVDSLVKNGDPAGTGFSSPYFSYAALSVHGLQPSATSIAASNVAFTIGCFPGNGGPSEVWRVRAEVIQGAGDFDWREPLASLPVWFRIRRAGSAFYAFTSTNGTDWVLTGAPDEFIQAPAVVRVGLLTMSWTDGVYAVAEYEGFGDTPANRDTIVQLTQPPTDVTVEANHAATFAAAASLVSGGPEDEVVYQWQAETSKGSGVFTNVYFGTSARFTTPPLSPADSGKRVRVLARAGLGAWVSSSPAQVTVVADVTPPTILSATTRTGWNELVVAFSERVDRNTAGDFLNYSGSDFGIAAATIDDTGTRVTLALSGPLDMGTPHTVTVGDIQDLASLTIQPNPSVVDVVLADRVPGRGAALQEYWFGINGTGLSGLRSDARFPAAPDLTGLVGALENPMYNVENYGARISGFLLPPVTGSYNFWMASDDQGEFWLSTDDNPINKMMVCSEPQWNAPRQYNTLTRRNPDAPQNRSSTLFPDGIPMVAGQAYYFEGLFKQGPGADNIAVAWQLPGGAPPRDGDSPIPGAFLALPGSAPEATLRLVRQPSNAVSVILPDAGANERVLISQDFTHTNGSFTVRHVGNPAGIWTYDAAAGGWLTQGSDNLPPSEGLLTSPPFIVTRAGSVHLTFQHRFSFEEPMWDGGQIRLGVNGGPFRPVPAQAFSSNGYTGPLIGDGALERQMAFANSSTGYASQEFVTSVASLGLFKPGDALSLQFLGSWDWNTEGAKPNWVIDSFELSEGHAGRSQVTFSAEAVARRLDGATAPVSYLWQRDCGQGFANIDSAYTATYAFFPSLADHGCRFRCLAFTPGASATSEPATLTVALPGITVTRDGGDLVFSWPSGTLQHADAAGGPWEDLAPTSPVRLAPTQVRRFYRLSKP